MYGPKWPFLLMYGSHDMRHTGFLQVDGLSTDLPRFGASHIASQQFKISPKQLFIADSFIYSKQKTQTNKLLKQESKNITQNHS